jgi:hypothetical protein
MLADTRRQAVVLPDDRITWGIVYMRMLTVQAHDGHGPAGTVDQAD